MKVSIICCLALYANGYETFSDVLISVVNIEKAYDVIHKHMAKNAVPSKKHGCEVFKWEVCAWDDNGDSIHSWDREVTWNGLEYSVDDTPFEIPTDTTKPWRNKESG